MRLLCTSLFALFILGASAQDFVIKDQEALFYNGTSDGLRTVWFSADNTKVYGDFNHLVAWDIKSHKLLFKNKITAGSGHKSCVSKDRKLWLQGGYGYNNPEKQDYNDMYKSISYGNPATNDITVHKVNDYSFWNMEYIDATGEVATIISDSKSYINSLVIYDLKTNKVSRTIATGASSSDVMASVGVSEDGKYVGVGYAGKNTRYEIYDCSTGKFLKSFSTDYEVNEVEIRKGKLYAGGGTMVEVVNINNLTVEKKIKTTASVFHMAVSPNGKSVAVGSFSSGADMIDVESGSVNHFSESLTNCLAFSPDGNMLAIGMYVTFHIPDITAVEIWVNENPHENEEEEETDLIFHDDPSNLTNTTFTLSEPDFSIYFPKEPEMSEKTNDKGQKSFAIKCMMTHDGYLVNISEISSKIKPKSYYKTSLSVADKFLSNMGEGVEVIDESDFDYKDGQGKEIIFKKGKFTYYYRSIIVNGYLYQTTYFTSKPKESNHEAFFKSFDAK